MRFLILNYIKMKYTEEDIMLDEKLTKLREERWHLEAQLSDNWQEMKKIFKRFKKQWHWPKHPINHHRYMERKWRGRFYG